MNFCSDCTNKNCPEEMPDQNSAACKHFKGKKITNGDLIRQMSDEELANLFAAACPPKMHKKCRGTLREECFACWFEYLASEVKSEGKND